MVLFLGYGLGQERARSKKIKEEKRKTKLSNLFYKYNIPTHYKSSVIHSQNYPTGSYMEKIGDLMGDCHLINKGDSFYLEFELDRDIIDYIGSDAAYTLSTNRHRTNRRSHLYSDDYRYRSVQEVHSFGSYYRSGDRNLYVEDPHSGKFYVDLGLHGAHLFNSNASKHDIQEFFERYSRAAHRHAYETFYREIHNNHKKGQTAIIKEAYSDYLENSKKEVIRYFHNVIDSEFVTSSNLAHYTENNHSFILRILMVESNNLLMDRLEVYSLVKDSIKRIQGMAEDYDVKVISNDFDESNIDIYIGLNLETIKKEIEDKLQLQTLDQTLDKFLQEAYVLRQTAE